MQVEIVGEDGNTKPEDEDGAAGRDRDWLPSENGMEPALGLAWLSRHEEARSRPAGAIAFGPAGGRCLPDLPPRGTGGGDVNRSDDDMS